ncbi:hypothetical protein BC826DRAFT_1091211 [Russula brevipes]|nr:hypothetical protein BC826DRAFT_1091211 [Russula brevipes]
MMDSASKHAPALRVAAVVSFYMGAALVTVLNSTPDAPLLFLFLQLIIAVIPQWDRHTVRKLVPVVTINIVGLVFNTLCLREVEATFFQVLTNLHRRGLVLPLTIAVTSATTHSHPSSRVIIAAGAVTVGFFVGVAPESGLPTASIPSPISLFYGVFSSLSIAVHSVLVKSSLPYCNNSTIQLAYWTNAGSAILLAPFVLLHGEPAKLLELSTSAEWDMKVFVWGSLVTGCFGFLLCVAGLLSIKVTSPITHMFSSAARSVIQTLLGVWLFSDILTVNRVISLSTILGGTMFYTWAKTREHGSPQPPAKPVDLEALNHVKDVKDESNDGQTQEKASASG